jgi:hypothetical protein
MPTTRKCLCALFALLLPASHYYGQSVEPGPAVDLLAGIRAGAIPRKKPHPVNPQWVGTVTIAAKHDPGNFYKEDTPEHMRITHAWMDQKNHLAAGRVAANRYAGSDVARYYETLPDAKDVAAARNLATLQRWFGPDHGFSGGWSAGWVCFTVTKGGQLRWQNVFAHLKHQGSPDPASVGIDIIAVREGILRVADPNSEEERKQFKTAEEIFAEAEAREKLKTDLHPEPLRSLVTAKKNPRDQDLADYAAALNEIRKNPDPRLFLQLAERMHEGTLEMRGYVEDILTTRSDFLRIKAWEPAPHAAALRHALAAMPSVEDAYTLEQLTEILLTSLGGGTMKLAEPPIDIEIKVSRDGLRSTRRRFDVKDDTLKASARKIQQWFRASYPQLKAP